MELTHIALTFGEIEKNDDDDDDDYDDKEEEEEEDELTKNSRT